jgi:hypothetical protein
MHFGIKFLLNFPCKMSENRKESIIIVLVCTRMVAWTMVASHDIFTATMQGSVV